RAESASSAIVRAEILDRPRRGAPCFRAAGPRRRAIPSRAPSAPRRAIREGLGLTRRAARMCAALRQRSRATFAPGRGATPGVKGKARGAHLWRTRVPERIRARIYRDAPRPRAANQERSPLQPPQTPVGQKDAEA